MMMNVATNELNVSAQKKYRQAVYEYNIYIFAFFLCFYTKSDNGHFGPKRVAR